MMSFVSVGYLSVVFFLAFATCRQEMLEKLAEKFERKVLVFSIK